MPATETPLPPDTRGAKRRVWGWYLFDFANSALIINGGLYFPQWIVLDNGISDIWFNLTMTISAVALLFTAVPLGALCDRARSRVPLLAWTSFAMFVATLAIAIVIATTSSVLTRGIVGLTAFAMIMYCYQLSLGVYNALLGDIAAVTQRRMTSGVGLALGWVGGVVGVLAVLPFVQPSMAFGPFAGRSAAFLPSAVLFALLSIVSISMIGRVPTAVRPQDERRPSSKGITAYLRDLKSRPGLALFLIGYFLFADAILTIQNNSPIYLDAVIGLSDTAKAGVFVGFLLTAACGALLASLLARPYEALTLLRWTVSAWVVVIIITALVSNALPFILLFLIMGVLFGALWNLSRLVFIAIIEPERRAARFGLYSIMERFATMLGPLLWASSAQLFFSAGSARYQIALAIMSIPLIVAFLVLSRAQRRMRSPPTSVSPQEQRSSVVHP